MPTRCRGPHAVARKTWAICRTDLRHGRTGSGSQCRVDDPRVGRGIDGDGFRVGRRRNVYRTNGDSWKVGQFGFALTVIGLGAVSLAVASVRHHQDVRHLRTAYGPVPPSNAVVIAQLVSRVWAVGWFSSRGIAGIEAAPRAVCTWLLARLLQQGTLASLRRLSRTRKGRPHANARRHGGRHSPSLKQRPGWIRHRDRARSAGGLARALGDGSRRRSLVIFASPHRRHPGNGWCES